MDHFDYVDGAMQVEQVPMAAIADAVGTPVYVYSTATLTRHVGVFRDALGSLHNPLIAFAVKANPNAAVLATLAKLGLGADVVSGGNPARLMSSISSSRALCLLSSPFGDQWFLMYVIAE